MQHLILLAKYEKFLKYFDRVLQNIPASRSNLRHGTENLLWQQVDLLYNAVMSMTPSKINAADTGLAAIRFRLRMLSELKVQITKIDNSTGEKSRSWQYLISRKNAETGEVLLSEVGAIIGSMKKGKQ